MYIHSLFRNESESLMPNDCHFGEQTVLVTIQIYWFRLQNNIIINSRAMAAKRNTVDPRYLNFGYPE